MGFFMDILFLFRIKALLYIYIYICRPIRIAFLEIKRI